MRSYVHIEPFSAEDLTSAAATLFPHNFSKQALIEYNNTEYNNMNPTYCEDDEESELIIMKKRKLTRLFHLSIMAAIMKKQVDEALYGQPASSRPSMIIRDRSSMEQFKELLGDHYFQRAYRMTTEQFENLVTLLEPYLPTKKGKGPNGYISAELEVSSSLRYFAGASMYDLILTHGISHSTLFTLVWRVVTAINNCPELNINFPNDHEEQKAIAAQFLSRSGAKFDNCVGCIDGLLICTEKPMERELEFTKCGSKSFYCGRKSKFGLNMQGVCSADGKFTAVWILHPAASSDYISLIRSQFYEKISTPGFLAPGCVIFGDNAYVSTDFMVTPYKNVRAGPKDDFNFYHSQLRVTVERAFGMLVWRWAILRHPMASRMGVQKQVALTMALCSLHNYCTKSTFDIDDEDVDNPMFNEDSPVVIDAETGVPVDLIDGCEHFEDVDDEFITEVQKSKVRYDMRKLVEKQGLHRTVISQQRNTNN